MADSYIDYFEVGEYGPHFVKETQKLVGASKLVDVEALRSRVEDAVATVNKELENAGIKRSELRAGRGGAAVASAALRKEIERFFNYLGSLDDDVSADKAAFFPGEKLGSLADLKPADLKARGDQVLMGFAAPSNVALPDGAKWKGKLEKARDDLGKALSDKGSASGTSITGTAELTAARTNFLTVYNGVAKRLIQGLLVELDRAEEYPLFFGDLLVHERPPAKKDAAPPVPDKPVP